VILIRDGYLNKFAPLRRDKLIHIDDIHEQLYPLKESNTDYITMSGKIYKYYYDNLYYLKKPIINKRNGYVYVSITFKDGINRNRRLHVLLAKMFIFNPKPKQYNIVGHKDNNKQNYELSNLYWTNNKENIQKAIDDGLNVERKAEDNEFSTYIIVKDKNTKEIVGVYGSLRECARCIDNITISTISKVYKKENYKPRTRKYIYSECSKEEFESYPNLQNIHLEENVTGNKNPKVFRMSNKNIRYSEIFDNQITASKICGISQGIISHILLGESCNPYNGWYFEMIDEIERKSSSAYQNQLATVDGYTIKNIKDGRILEFESGEELKKYFGLRGHDIRHYIKKNHILMSEWKIISSNNKEELGNLNAG
jgi:hypothetical protein